jgi:membrane protein implicated in regulation of membrane protease activity
MSGRMRRIIGALLFIVAVLMFAGAILSTVISLNLRASGVKTNATVVSVSTNVSRRFTGTSSSYTHTYTDLIQFTTADGKTYRDSIGGARGDSIGQTIAVVYDPSNPNTVQTASSLTGLWWITPVALLLFAVLFGWLGRRLRRVRPSPRQEPEVAPYL